MADRDRDLEEVEALVKENRNAFLRAKRLLLVMRQRSQEQPNREEPHAPNVAEDSGGPTLRDGGLELPCDGSWLNLENNLANVELGPREIPADLTTSALSNTSAGIWRPKEPGQQTIRLVFAAPQYINKIRVVFVEKELERTQEFVLRWLSQGATGYKEILRQQYVFSPNGSTCEVEEYQVDLKNLMSIELSIVPDVSGRTAFASLSRWSLATATQQTHVSCSGR